MTPLAYLKAIVMLTLAVLLFVGGCASQARRDVGKLADKDKALLQASMDLKTAQQALALNALAFVEIDAAAQEQVAEAVKRAELSDDLAAFAAKAEVKAKHRADAFAQEVAAAKRRAPCRALLESDLEAVCGISLH